MSNLKIKTNDKELGDVYDEQRESYERVSFKLPSINRDQQINLGQSIIALIGVNISNYISDNDTKENIGLMFIDILKHFDITVADLHKMDLLENVLDPDYDYEIDVTLSHKILSKKEA